jgi:hypothetical protein
MPGDVMRKKDLDPLIFRWKKTTRALKIHDQYYGKYITDILERCTDADLVLFTDPVEAAAFFCLLDLAGKIPGDPYPARPIVRKGQVPLLPECCPP